MEYLWIFYMFFSFNLKHQDDDPTWHVSHGLKPWAKPNSKPSHSPPNLLVILHHSSHRGISWDIMAIYPIISNIYIYIDIYPISWTMAWIAPSRRHQHPRRTSRRDRIRVCWIVQLSMVQSFSIHMVVGTNVLKILLVFIEIHLFAYFNCFPHCGIVLVTATWVTPAGSHVVLWHHLPAFDRQGQ